MAEYKRAFLADMLKESIQQGTTPSLTVSSNSMSPLLRSGDQIGLQKLDPAAAQPGQIITFTNLNEADDLITHRVAGTTLDHGVEKIATYGDRSLLFDSPVAFDDVLGVVVWRRRSGRVLNLANGRGAKLSKTLGRQARERIRDATGLPPDHYELNRKSLVDSNQLCLRYRKKMSVRFLWRAKYLWASILTLFMEYLPQSRGQE